VIVTSGKAELATETTGSGRPDVLLLHAGVTDQRSWTTLRERMPGRCLSYDARGYGGTTYEPEPGWSAVGDALAVLAAYDAAPAVVVGGSVGGRTAVDLALASPEAVSALVLIAPAVSGSPHHDVAPGAEQELDRLVEDAEERGDLAELNRLEARCWLDGPSQREGRVTGAVRDLFLEMNAIALAAPDPGAETPPAEGAWERLGEIAVPTLMLVGEHDFRQFGANARDAAGLIPGCRLVELPGVAHLPQLESDELTLRTVEEFVRSLDR
jgi:pimeloyl-ACP methyl ester carboxylesterase